MRSPTLPSPLNQTLSFKSKSSKTFLGTTRSTIAERFDKQKRHGTSLLTSATKAPQPERKNNNVSSDERSKEIGGGKRSVDPPSEPYALAPRRLF